MLILNKVTQRKLDKPKVLHLIDSENDFITKVWTCNQKGEFVWRSTQLFRFLVGRNSVVTTFLKNLKANSKRGKD